MNQTVTQESYEFHMGMYRRACACGNWTEAVAQIESAIHACPVEEALEKLTQLRNDAVLKAAPRPWWSKIWHGVTA